MNMFVQRRQVFLYTIQQYGDMEGRWMNKAEMELKLELTRNTILLVEVVKELKGQICSQHCIFVSWSFVSIIEVFEYLSVVKKTLH